MGPMGPMGRMDPMDPMGPVGPMDPMDPMCPVGVMGSTARSVIDALPLDLFPARCLPDVLDMMPAGCYSSCLVISKYNHTI